MKLGTKINLLLVTVATIVFSLGFFVIINIESSSLQKQVSSDTNTIKEILRDNIERMFSQINAGEGQLQAIVEKLSKIEGVKYIDVASVDGYYIATTNRNLVGQKVSDIDASYIAKILTDGKIVHVKKDEGAFYEFESRIPIRTDNDINSKIIDVIEVEVITKTKSASDADSAQKLLQAISVSIEESARSMMLLKNEDISAIQKITDDVLKFNYFHDLIVFDKFLNVVASTGNAEEEFLNSPEEHRRVRENVLSGKEEKQYDRIHRGSRDIVSVSPISAEIDDKTEIVGVLEVHIRRASFEEKVNELVLRMVGVGIILTAVIVIVLAIILRREVVAPITKYSEIAKKIADGDLSQKVEDISDDEIGQFGDVFNSMVANLRELDRLKSDFISVAAHQLRTPLSGVKWVLKLLLDGDLGSVNDDQKGMLKRGFDTNEKMIQLVNDLLNVSRIENGKFGYDFKKNDFMKLVQLLVENTELLSKERNIEVRLENRATNLPEFLFDPEKLLIALQNLVDNAVKYTLPGGRVTIIVERQGDYVQVKVSDTGVGIPKEDLPKLFSKFFRAANVIHLQTDGSGLGLFIVKNIILRHGGQIWVDSEEGKGATFIVVIPVIAELLPKEVENRI